MRIRSKCRVSMDPNVASASIQLSRQHGYNVAPAWILTLVGLWFPQAKGIQVVAYASLGIGALLTHGAVAAEVRLRWDAVVRRLRPRFVYTRWEITSQMSLPEHPCLRLF